MKTLLLVIWLQLPVARAMVSPYYESVRAIQKILESASEISSAMGTAYPIESITRSPDGKSYVVTASNTRDELCSIEVFVEPAPGCGPSMGGMPSLVVRLGKVEVRPRP